MFRKVLVVEDLDTVSYGIKMMLQHDLGISEIKSTKHCDKAYVLIENMAKTNEPFDLLITDLSFKQDHTPARLNSGKALIEKIREKKHTLPIIICSVEKKPAMVQRFIKKNNVSAYVLKGRNGLRDLKQAIKTVFRGELFLSNEINTQDKVNAIFEIEDYDVSLLIHLSQGLSQTQIATEFSTAGIEPNSLSSIEKKLNRLKDVLKANNNVQLVSNAKDLGLI